MSAPGRGRACCAFFAFAIAAALSLFPRIARAQDDGDACHAAAGAPVERIEVYGLQTVAPGIVEDAVKLRPGMIVSPLSLTKLENQILATGLFAEVSVVIASENDDCVLRVRVTEYARVTDIRFPDVSVYGTSQLLSLIDTKIGAVPNRDTVDADGAKIVAKYHEDGYEAARLLGTDLAGGVATFRVDEGHIRKVEVVGARRTGAHRVRQILGIHRGDIYNTSALIDGQAALYRTGLFSVVGFGVETPHDAGIEPEGIVLTVTVGEILAPFSRTDVFADRDQSALSIEARIRNLARGHSARAAVFLLGQSPGDLAENGFDEFYLLRADGELRFFRPTETAAGAFLGIDGDVAHGRRRVDVAHAFDLDRPAGRVGVEIPTVHGENWEGTGSFSGELGLRVLRYWKDEPNGAPLSTSEAGFVRGLVGFELHRISGVETPARLSVQTGVEWNGGARPLSFIDASGEAHMIVLPHLSIETEADAGALTGQYIPFWREYALEGANGPLGFGHDYAFARQYARGRGDLVGSGFRSLVHVAAGADGVAFGGSQATRAGHATALKSLHLELRAGPPFAHLRAGVAAPLPGSHTSDLWWYVGLTVGTPQ